MEREALGQLPAQVHGVVGPLIGGQIVAVVTDALVNLVLHTGAPFVLEAMIDDHLDRVAKVEPDGVALERRGWPVRLHRTGRPG